MAKQKLLGQVGLEGAVFPLFLLLECGFGVAGELGVDLCGEGELGAVCREDGAGDAEWEVGDSARFAAVHGHLPELGFFVFALAAHGDEVEGLSVGAPDGVAVHAFMVGHLAEQGAVEADPIDVGLALPLFEVVGHHGEEDPFPIRRYGRRAE